MSQLLSGVWWPTYTIPEPYCTGLLLYFDRIYVPDSRDLARVQSPAVAAFYQRIAPAVGAGLIEMVPWEVVATRTMLAAYDIPTWNQYSWTLQTLFAVDYGDTRAKLQYRETITREQARRGVSGLFLHAASKAREEFADTVGLHLWAREHGICLVTEDVDAASALAQAHVEIVALSGARGIDRDDLQAMTSAARAALVSCDQVLPVVAARTIEDSLELREKLRDELVVLRDTIRTSITGLHEVDIDRNQVRDVHDHLVKVTSPVADALERRLRSPSPVILRHLGNVSAPLTCGQLRLSANIFAAAEFTASIARIPTLTTDIRQNAELQFRRLFTNPISYLVRAT